MKKCLIVISIELFTAVLGFAQDSYLPIRYFWGWEQVDSIKKEVINKNHKSVVYTHNSDDKGYNTVLILSVDKDLLFWHIRNDTVISNGKLKSDSIFLYKDYRKTGAVQKEKLAPDTFIPPVVSGSECIAYKDSSVVFYFEYGNTDSHKELPERKKYREEWLKIIRHELNPIIVLHGWY